MEPIPCIKSLEENAGLIIAGKFQRKTPPEKTEKLEMIKEYRQALRDLPKKLKKIVDPVPWPKSPF